MFRLTWKNLLAHKRRLFSTFLAVVIGVAFLSGNLMLTDTITKTFNDLFANVDKGTDAVVRSSTKISTDFGNDIRGRIPISLLPTVQGVERREGGGAAGAGLRPDRRLGRQDARQSGTGRADVRGQLVDGAAAQPVPHRRRARAAKLRRDRHRQEVVVRRPSEGG